MTVFWISNSRMMKCSFFKISLQIHLGPGRYKMQINLVANDMKSRKDGLLKSSITFNNQLTQCLTWTVCPRYRPGRWCPCACGQVSRDTRNLATFGSSHPPSPGQTSGDNSLDIKWMNDVETRPQSFNMREAIHSNYMPLEKKFWYVWGRSDISGK